MMPTFPDYWSAHAADYARHRPRYPDRLFHWLAALVPAHQRAWDCATGNGQAAAGGGRPTALGPEAACAQVSHFDQVIATDASASQIHCATPHPRVIYRVATADASGIAAQTVDLVTVAQAVHWFALDAFYQEVRRVAKPDGVIAVWCYDLFHVAPELDRLIRDYDRDIVGPYWPSERRWVEDGYRSLPFPFEDVAAPSFEMTVKWPLQAVLEYLWTWSATQRYLQARGVDPLVSLRRALEPAWGEAEQPRKVVWALHLRVGRVREQHACA